MQQKNIDVICLQAMEAPFKYQADIHRLKISFTIWTVMTELGANEDVLPHRLQSFTEQFLASSLAVAGCRVEEITTRLKRLLNDLHCLVFIANSPIRVGQLPGPQPDLRDVHASNTKWT